MLKKLISLSLCLLMILPFAGCDKKEESLSVDTNPETSSKAPEPEYFINPLTGVKNLDEEAALKRPVAIMVNNLATAQNVQTGLNKADVIYETEVEGGITRLIALYKDFENAGQIGTVRSARYVYIDLAAGHDAIYAYHGRDEVYAGPHMNAVDNVVLGTDNGGKRISNGLASEHTLYAFSDKFWENIEKTKIKTTLDKEASPWLNFSDEKTPVKLDYTATRVSIPFSTSYKTTFQYDEASGRYTRFFRDTERKDYVTGESITVKNVFVLNTTISYYSNNKHRNIDLTSGDGYYFVNGTYTKIKWSKGSASNSFVFTNEDGTPLTVNAGNSWVCIADKNTSQPIIG